LISDSGRYALRALAELALLPQGQYLGSASLAGQVDVPANYLSKLLQLLSRIGLLDSQKGAGGGFRLARPAEQIALIEVLDPIDRVRRWEGCVLGNEQCPGDSPCALHDGWGKVRDSYITFLEHTSVAQLARSPASNELAAPAASGG